MNDEILYDEKTLKRYRNLRMFNGKSDEEIIEYLNTRDPKPEKEDKTPIEVDADDEAYQRRYNSKLRQLQKEFVVDMNDSNDAESLRMLVRYAIQLEMLDDKIRKSFSEPASLKNFTDAQRSLSMSINDLQDKLGISRKARKEKQNDDVPQFLAGLQVKAAEFWKRSTVPITCPRCNIELARTWVNFPKERHTLSFDGDCWKCKERVLFEEQVLSEE